jgi:hypothetical protein
MSLVPVHNLDQLFYPAPIHSNDICPHKTLCLGVRLWFDYSQKLVERFLVVLPGMKSVFVNGFRKVFRNPPCGRSTAIEGLNGEFFDYVIMAVRFVKSRLVFTLEDFREVRDF